MRWACRRWADRNNTAFPNPQTKLGASSGLMQLPRRPRSLSPGLKRRCSRRFRRRPPLGRTGRAQAPAARRPGRSSGSGRLRGSRFVDRVVFATSSQRDERRRQNRRARAADDRTQRAGAPMLRRASSVASFPSSGCDAEQVHAPSLRFIVSEGIIPLLAHIPDTVDFGTKKRFPLR